MQNRCKISFAIVTCAVSEPDVIRHRPCYSSEPRLRRPIVIGKDGFPEFVSTNEFGHLKQNVLFNPPLAHIHVPMLSINRHVIRQNRHSENKLAVYEFIQATESIARMDSTHWYSNQTSAGTSGRDWNDL